MNSVRKTPNGISEKFKYTENGGWLMVSNFRENLSFFETIGIFDVVLPFLLVFTIVFAILEKTKVFGTDDIGGVKYSKKNLNAIT